MDNYKILAFIVYLSFIVSGGVWQQIIEHENIPLNDEVRFWAFVVWSLSGFMMVLLFLWSIFE